MSGPISGHKTPPQAAAGRLSRSASFLLIAILLFSVLTAGFHRHADNLPHGDCAVCAASHTPAIPAQSGNAPSHAGAVSFETFHQDQFLLSAVRALSGARAPPL